LAVQFPVIANRLSLLYFVSERPEIPGSGFAARAVPFHPEIEISLYFSLFL
jgi:hypothetical protein